MAKNPDCKPTPECNEQRGGVANGEEAANNFIGACGRGDRAPQPRDNTPFTSSDHDSPWFPGHGRCRNRILAPRRRDTWLAANWQNTAKYRVFGLAQHVHIREVLASRVIGRSQHPVACPTGAVDSQETSHEED